MLSVSAPYASSPANWVSPSAAYLICLCFACLHLSRQQQQQQNIGLQLILSTVSDIFEPSLATGVLSEEKISVLNISEKNWKYLQTIALRSCGQKSDGWEGGQGGTRGGKGGTCHDQSSEVSPGFNIPIIEVEAFHENIFAQENSSSFHKSNIND